MADMLFDDVAVYRTAPLADLQTITCTSMISAMSWCTLPRVRQEDQLASKVRSSTQRFAAAAYYTEL